jgi:hypothetical protein
MIVMLYECDDFLSHQITTFFCWRGVPITSKHLAAKTKTINNIQTPITWLIHTGSAHRLINTECSKQSFKHECLKPFFSNLEQIFLSFSVTSSSYHGRRLPGVNFINIL